MKMTKDKIKGITLIEVIISVALLSILIIPVSAMVMTSLQINKKAEYKQKSAYIGQQILEELKVYNDINLQDDSNFQLLDGNFINKYIEADNKYDFIGDFTRDGYKINVTLKRDSIFEYKDSNKSVANIIKPHFDFKIKLLNDPLQAVKDDSVSTPINVSNQLVLKVDNISTIGEISLLDKGQITALLSDNKLNNFEGKILLHLDSSFINQTITEIEVQNEGNDKVEIYIERNKDSTFKYEDSNKNGDNIINPDPDPDLDPDSDFDFRINFLNDQVQVKDNSFISKNISNQLILKVNDTVNDKVDDIPSIGITLLDKGQITPLLSESKSNDIKGKILLYLDSSFINQTITEIEVQNERNDGIDGIDGIEIYVERNQESTGKINIKSTKGKVKIYNNILETENISESENKKIGDLYNIEVSVSRGNDVLFTGTGTNNIIIRN